MKYNLKQLLLMLKSKNDNHVQYQADASNVCAIDALKTFSKTSLLK